MTVDSAGGRNIGDRIFVNEDLSRPENRINVAMFGLLAQDWFRIWLLSKLKMPENAVIYPPTNTGEFRPDFTIETPDGCRTLGWIEVEVANDKGQVRKYGQRYQESVKTIWGRDSHEGDLSLENIAEHIRNTVDGGSLAAQAKLHALLLHKLIVHALAEAPSTSKPVAVSEQTKLDHWLVRPLVESLGDLLDLEMKPAVRGRLKANARGESGFSLRVFSCVAKSGEVSILNIRGGADDVYFATRSHLEKYLPDHGEAIAAWVEQVRQMGGEIDVQDGEQSHVRYRVSISDALMPDVTKCLIALSNPA